MVPSNACKFTPAGGQLLITTKLVIPNLAPDEDSDEKGGYVDFPTPGFSDKDADALSSTAVGSEGRSKCCGAFKHPITVSDLR